MRINFFGDFVAKEVDNLQLSSDIASVLLNAEYNVVNFEAPINTLASRPIEKSGPSLCQDSNAPSWLKSHNFNVIALANNHIYDYGEEALLNTVNSFRGSYCFGAGDWKNAYTPLIIQHEGVKVGLIAVTHCEFGTLYDKWDKKQKVGTAWIHDNKLPQLIKSTKDKVDILVIMPHAGVENIEVPLPEYRDLYRSYIDWGADVIIASHPHIIQGYEEYKSKYIFYSLGNFYFPWDGEEKQPSSWYRGLSVSLEYEEGRLRIEHRFTSFQNNLISLSNEDVLEKKFVGLNHYLVEDCLYMEKVNQLCLDLLEQYYKLFYHGGLLNVRSNDLIKSLLKVFFKRSKISVVHLLNSIRCESHRYAIIRALRLKELII